MFSQVESVAYRDKIEKRLPFSNSVSRDDYFMKETREIECFRNQYLQEKTSVITFVVFL